MKKLFAMFLALAMLLTMVGSCAVAEEKIHLTGMCWGSTAQYEQLVADVLATNPELAEKYEVSWVLGGEGDDNSAEKMRLALSANENLCDFVVLNYTQIPEFARAEALVDISEALKPYADTMTTAALGLSQYEGQTIAVPFEVKTKVWFYRSDIFEECGVQVEDITDTDSFIAAGKKIQEKYPNSYMWNFGSNVSDYAYYLTLSGVIADISDWTPDWENALANGTILTQPCAAWLGQDIFLPKYSGAGNQWKVTTWPVIGGTDAGSDAGGSVMAVPAFSAHPEEAAELISYICLSEEGSKCVFHMTGSLPQNTVALADDSLFADQANGYFGTTFVDAQKSAVDKFAIFNYSPNASSEQTIVCEYFTKAVNGQMSIDEALNAAQADLQTTIGNAFN